MYTENDFRLYHHGILGQKWGIRNGTHYPLSPGDHSASEQKAGWRKSLNAGGSGGGSLLSKAKNRIKQKQEAKRLSAAEKAEQEKKAADEKAEQEKKAAAEKAKQEKEAAVLSGNAKKIYELAQEGKFSVNELQQAVNRVNLYNQLKNSMPKEQPKPETIDKIKSVADKLKTVTNAAKNGVEFYNELADIVNSISPDYKMKKIGAFDTANEERIKKAEMDAIEAVFRTGNKEAMQKELDNMTGEQLSKMASIVKAKSKVQNYINGKDDKNDNDD